MLFNHIGIKCSDLEASIRFYTEAMGFRKLYELEVLGKPCVFVGNDTLEIELESSGSKAAPPANAPEHGLTHFAFMVDDIDGLAKTLAARGAPFLIPPFNVRPTRKICLVKAPDGVLIQLIQDFPESK